jgi:hypothetical protein
VNLTPTQQRRSMYCVFYKGSPDQVSLFSGASAINGAGSVVGFSETVSGGVTATRLVTFTRRYGCATKSAPRCLASRFPAPAGAPPAELEVVLIDHAGHGAGTSVAPDPGELAGGEPGSLVPHPGLESGVQVGKLPF